VLARPSPFFVAIAPTTHPVVISPMPEVAVTRPIAEARGKLATEENIVAAGRVAAEHTDPTADQRGPEDYKRHLAAELTTRALRRAINRAQGLGA